MPFLSDGSCFFLHTCSLNPCGDVNNSSPGIWDSLKLKYLKRKRPHICRKKQKKKSFVNGSTVAHRTCVQKYFNIYLKRCELPALAKFGSFSPEPACTPLKRSRRRVSACRGEAPLVLYYVFLVLVSTSLAGTGTRLLGKFDIVACLRVTS